jgi:hypothetical protein
MVGRGVENSRWPTRTSHLTYRLRETKPNLQPDGTSGTRKSLQPDQTLSTRKALQPDGTVRTRKALQPDGTLGTGKSLLREPSPTVPRQSQTCSVLSPVEFRVTRGIARVQNSVKSEGSRDDSEAHHLPRLVSGHLSHCFEDRDKPRTGILERLYSMAAQAFQGKKRPKTSASRCGGRPTRYCSTSISSSLSKLWTPRSTRSGSALIATFLQFPATPDRIPQTSDRHRQPREK